MLASKKNVRQIMNKIDRQGHQITLTAQAELDLLAQKISSELESTSREVNIVETAVGQIKPILERIKSQMVTYQAPEGLLIAMESAVGEILSKVDTAKGGCAAAHKNVADVANIKKDMDEATNKIAKQVQVIDELTNSYQD